MPDPTYTENFVDKLIISKISKTKFDELSGAGMLNENEIYLVEDEQLDAGGLTVENVATPISATDATNKGYVDGLYTNAIGAIDSATEYLTGYVNEVSGYIENDIISATSGLASFESLTSVSGELSSSIDGKLNSTAGAPDFQASATYFVNEYVNRGGSLYRCVSAVTSSGAWNPDNWELTDMTTPDATLDITNQGALRVVGADGTILWMQGYTLATSSSSAISNEAVNRFDFTNNVTSASLVLPTAPNGKVGDFVLDVLNTATTSANFEIAGLDSSVVVVIPAGESLVDMMTFESGAMSELYFTTTSFAISGIPTWKVVRQDVENGGSV